MFFRLLFVNWPTDVTASGSERYISEAYFWSRNETVIDTRQYIRNFIIRMSCHPGDWFTEELARPETNGLTRLAITTSHAVSGTGNDMTFEMTSCISVRWTEHGSHSSSRMKPLSYYQLASVYHWGSVPGLTLATATSPEAAVTAWVIWRRIQVIPIYLNSIHFPNSSHAVNDVYE